MAYINNAGLYVIWKKKKKKTIAFRYVLISKSNCDWGGTKCWQMATGCPCKKVIEEKGMVLKMENR